MTFGDHVRTTGGALRNWFVAQTQDAFAVAALWLVGLLILRVPLWYVWAPLAFIFQYVPHYGTILSLLGPAIAAGRSRGWMGFVYVLILYAVVVIVDGFVLQPMLMKRAAKVPVWASIVVPVVLGFVVPFWGVLIAPPLLAVFFTYWNRRNREREVGE
jgi:predicted PurR-regulated permease PerM